MGQPQQSPANVETVRWLGGVYTFGCPVRAEDGEPYLFIVGRNAEGVIAHDQEAARDLFEQARALYESDPFYAAER